MKSGWPTRLPPLTTDIRTFRDIEELSFAAAGLTVSTMEAASTARGRCSLVLSGGTTPRRLHELLATRFSHDVPWKQVHVFWADERYVPHDHADSNYRMARETLLDHVPCPAHNIYPMPTHHADPDAAAQEYEATLRTFFAGQPPRFDLALLGIGDDGHTASLFPETPAMSERDRWVVAVRAPAQPPTRLTLTLPLLSGAARTCFLAAGAGKALEIERVRSGDDGGGRYPAVTIGRLGQDVTWFVDERASGGPHGNEHLRRVDPALHEET